MGVVRGGRLLARTLKEHGVRYIFSLSGDLINALYDGCLDEGIRIVDFRHEQAAVHAAEGWARCTGEPGVAAVTGGPGVTNTITGLANALHGGSPLLLLAGRRPLAETDKGSFGEQDALSIVSPVTKWSRTVFESHRVPEYVEQALSRARSGRPGPVFLEMPVDILDHKGRDPGVSSPLPLVRPQGDPQLVEEAAGLLRKAKRPMVLAGSGVWWAGACRELQQFIEETHLPLCSTHMGRGAVPDDHPLCLGAFKGGLREADAVLVLGTRLNWTLDFGRLIHPRAKVIQVDIEESEIGRTRPVAIGIAGDLGLVLPQLLDALGPRPARSAWLKRLHELRAAFLQEFEGCASSQATPVHPLRLCRELASFLGRDFTLALDGGETKIWAAMALRAYQPGHWLDSGAFGSLGAGLPFALSAKLARPNDRVVLLTGDGSFGFCAMEIDTAVRLGLPVVTVIANDGAWGMIKHMQEEAYGSGRAVATDLGWVRYDRMAEALGGYGEFVERPEDIAPALERAFTSGKPAVINVKCEPNVASPYGKRFLA
ncbi:MAG: thiamine pyrophosphate-binding protein [Dehalococcoidia bacterium]|nr:thiamine pyrophosphate-binding protein [Dehalococcoidia bacterium]